MAKTVGEINVENVKLHTLMGCPCRDKNESVCEGKWCVCGDDPQRGGILLPRLDCKWRPFWMIQAEAFTANMWVAIGRNIGG